LLAEPPIHLVIAFAVDAKNISLRNILAMIRSLVQTV
jgi:hypothetical protein